jgi:hypothetical protein
MTKNEKISKIGYDYKNKKFLGYKINIEKAFKNTHPK